MFAIPEPFLSKLKCTLCDGYLNANPVVIKDGKQICAKCYKILPHDEREQCVREITFEAIASCLVFPCRYHKMGCDHTFTWNNENGHETECKKRYFTFPDVVTTDKGVTDQPVDDAAQIKSGNTNVAFNNDFTDDDQNFINLNLEGAVSFNNNKKTSGEDNNNVIYENIYDSISSPKTSNPKKVFYCLSCNAEVDKTTQHLCLFGHISCNSCKSDMCVACVKNLDGNSRVACKNASKGCQELLYQNDVGVHRDNCEFNEITCPLDKCNGKYILQKLIKHLKEEHTNEIILVPEVTRKMGQEDKTLIFLCHESLFKCLYFYYFNSIELLLIYLGPCVKASAFSLEITVEVNGKKIIKKLKCANWNNYMLAGGLSLDQKELPTNDGKPMDLTIHLKILRDKLA